MNTIKKIATACLCVASIGSGIYVVQQNTNDRIAREFKEPNHTSNDLSNGKNLTHWIW